MSLDELLNKIFVAPEAKEVLSIVTRYASQCDSFLEFGSRGGVSAAAVFKGLVSTTREFPPRFVAVDLVNDDSIKTLGLLADKSGISFHFWQGHTRHYPLHETDGFIWDTFHTGGALFGDLQRVAPYVQKCIFVLGVGSNGEVSVAVKRNMDIPTVARELMVTEEEAKSGLNQGIREFLEKNTDWREALRHGEIVVLERVKPAARRLFPQIEPGTPKN
jgi:hypothetical protein